MNRKPGRAGRTGKSSTIPCQFPFESHPCLSPQHSSLPSPPLLPGASARSAHQPSLRRHSNRHLLMPFLRVGGCKAEIGNKEFKGPGHRAVPLPRCCGDSGVFLVAPRTGLYTSASPGYSYSLCRLRQRLWLYLEIAAVFDRREYGFFSAKLKAAGWFLVHAAGPELCRSAHGPSESVCASKMHIAAASRTSPSRTAALAADAVPGIFIPQQRPGRPADRCQHQHKQI